jgi:hypothetical protein
MYAKRSNFLKELSKKWIGKFVQKVFCTFNPLVGDIMERCRPNESLAFYRSFYYSDNATIPGVNFINILFEPF